MELFASTEKRGQREKREAKREREMWRIFLRNQN